MRMHRHGAGDPGIHVGLRPVGTPDATARAARLHARPRICGRPKLFLLAWPRIRIWHWVWGRVLGGTARILWRSVRAPGIWLVRWVWGLRCRTSTIEHAGSTSFAAATRAATIQEKILRALTLRSTRVSRPKKDALSGKRHAESILSVSIPILPCIQIDKIRFPPSSGLVHPLGLVRSHPHSP